MAKSAGVISINLNAGTAQFIQDLDRAKAKVTDFGRAGAGMGHGMVSGTMAASGAIRVLEGNVQNNIRAVERFLSTTLNLGGVLQAAFPLVGGIAFLGLIGKLGEEAYKFFKDMEQAPQKIAGAFRELNAPLRLTNDELRVANDRLANDIAKLEGKRQNTLKLAIDEARVAVDKLSDSTERALSGLNKLLSEHQVGLAAQFFGQAGTGDIKKELGGETGLGGFTGRIAEISDKGNASVSSATSAAAADTARAAMNKALLAETDTEIAKMQKLLDTAKQESTSEALHGGYYQGKDERARIEQLQGTLRALHEIRNSVPLQAENSSLTQRKGALEASRANAEQDRPYQDRIKALNADLDGIKAKLAAVGSPAAEQAITAAFAESIKVIEEVNKALEKHHTKLTDAEMGQISLTIQQTASAKAQIDWNTKLDETTKKIADQVQSQEMLTAAIGKGYDAVKKANVETQLMRDVGPERYNDPANAGALDKLRSGLGAAYDAQNADKSAAATDKLQGQIELERSLAQVQMQGAEAVRLVTLAYRLRDLAANGATKDQIKAEIELFNATRQNADAADVAKINQRIDAVQRLTAAQVKGAEAARQAELENKYAEMAKGGASPDAVNKQRSEDEAQHQEQITAKVMESVNAYKNRLQVIDEEEAKLKEIAKQYGDTADIERSLRDLENQRLQIAVEQALQGRSAMDGVRAFFLEMQQQAKSSAEIIYETLNSALDKVSDQFAKLLAGQKTSFGKMIQGLGEDMLKSTIKSGLQTGLGAIGKAFGITPGTGKPDGTENNPIWVKMAGSGLGSGGKGDILFGNGGILGTGATPKEGADDGGDSDSPAPVGGILGKIFGGLFGKLIPHAAGGGVSASSAYLVGEQGPEILTGASGRIFSNADSNRMMSGGGGDNHYYSIDARGTDPVQTEARVRQAIIASHNSAVGTSIQASQDRQRRVPVGA